MEHSFSPDVLSMMLGCFCFGTWPHATTQDFQSPQMARRLCWYAASWDVLGQREPPQARAGDRNRLFTQLHECHVPRCMAERKSVLPAPNRNWHQEHCALTLACPFLATSE